MDMRSHSCIGEASCGLAGEHRAESDAAHFIRAIYLYKRGFSTEPMTLHAMHEAMHATCFQ